MNYILVYDFETDGSNPNLCDPVQLASCVIHPITLEIVEDSEFSVNIRPTHIEHPDYFIQHEQTIRWHAKQYGCEPEEILEKWKNSLDQKIAWTHFTNYLERYNKRPARNSRFDSLIRAGANIIEFDNIIVDRLAYKYGDVDKDGQQTIFFPRDIIDIQDLAFYWFFGLPEPKAYNMDELRRFFGLPPHPHDALLDVKDEALIISKFMQLHRRLAPKINFKGSLGKKHGN